MDVWNFLTSCPKLNDVEGFGFLYTSVADTGEAFQFAVVKIDAKEDPVDVILVVSLAEDGGTWVPSELQVVSRIAVVGGILVVSWVDVIGLVDVDVVVSIGGPALPGLKLGA